MIDNFEYQLKADFKNFLYYIWKCLHLPPPTDAQYVIADYLQDTSTRRKIIEAFRGIGKSWITSAYVLWRLYKDPNYKALVVSASKSRSDDFTAFTKKLIKEIPILNHLQPKDDQRNSMIAFDVGPADPAHAPSVKSVGIFGQLTGSRAVEIIGDDVEVQNNSATQDLRDKLMKACLEFEAIIVPEIGQITYLGTPQTEESIYNKLSERGYKPLIIPAEYPSEADLAKYQGNLASFINRALEKNPKLAGKPTDPKRFNEIELLERKSAYGRSGYALQFMLDTSLSDADRYPLKLSDLIITSLSSEKAPISIVWSSAPENQIKELPNVGFTGDRFFRPMYSDKEYAPYEGSIMFIDPAGRGKDEIAYAVVKQLHGYLHVTSVSGFKGGYEDTNLIKLAKIAKEQQVNRILIESNFGDGMFLKIFTPVLAKYYACTMEEVRNTIQKEKRIIDTLEPVMNRHRLIFDIEVVKADLKPINDLTDAINYSLFYQLTRITKDRGSLKHDDRLDALAGAVAYWINSMARDEEKAVEDYKERLLEEELSGFLEHVVDKEKYGIVSNRWFDY
jgi:hypothetical protein